MLTILERAGPARCAHLALAQRLEPGAPATIFERNTRYPDFLAQLRRALQSRDVIGQAKGILMERRGISADEAFAVLRAASQSLNVKLTQVAQTLVERRADL